MPTGALLRAPLPPPGPGGTRESAPRDDHAEAAWMSTGTETAAHGFPRSIVWVGSDRIGVPF